MEYSSDSGNARPEWGRRPVVTALNLVRWDDVINDGEQTAKNNKIKPYETRGFNVENPPNVEGKNYGRQPANLHYTGCVFTTPNSGLQEELSKLCSVGSRPFLVQ